MVCCECLEAAAAQLSGDIHHIFVRDRVLPDIFDQQEELLPVVLEVAMEDVLHLPWHLVERLRVRQRRGFLHKSLDIMVDVNDPFIRFIASYVFADDLVPSVEYGYPVAVHPYRHCLPGHILRNGVMAVLHAHGGLLVRLVFGEFIAAYFSGVSPEVLHLLPHPVLLTVGRSTSDLGIESAANAVKPLLGRLDSVKVDIGGECSTSDKIDAAFDIALLPAGSGIAEPPLILVK